MKQILGSQASGLQGLLQRAQQLNKLNEHLNRLLSPPLSCHCTVASLEQQTLTLITDSPAWATRLRLETPNLIKGLRDFQIKSLTIKIQQPQQVVKTARKARPQVSPDTANLLNHIAESTSDPKLKGALLRLARHLPK